MAKYKKPDTDTPANKPTKTERLKSSSKFSNTFRMINKPFAITAAADTKEFTSKDTLGSGIGILIRAFLPDGFVVVALMILLFQPSALRN